MDSCLIDKIENLREEMIRVACATGINSPEAIEISRRLDRVLNELNDIRQEYELEKM